MDEFVSKKLLVAKFNELASKYTDRDKRQRGLAYATAADIIAFTDAADVQPIKHGRWIWVKDYRDCEGDIYSQYKCSCCDFGVGGVYSVKDLTHFCGNCGARMDGDVE